VAVVLGAYLAIGEAVRTWGAGRPVYAWLDDFLLAALLFIAAAQARRSHGPALFTGAFGVAAGMLYGSFFGHLAEWNQPDPGNLPQRCLTVAIGLAFGGSLIGLGLSLREAIISARGGQSPSGRDTTG
jgi:hypothetical protein